MIARQNVGMSFTNLRESDANLQKIADFEWQTPKNSVFGVCFVREFTKVSDHSGRLLGRSVGSFRTIGERPQVFFPSQKRTAASLPNGSAYEFSMISLHYVKENKSTYNSWKKTENAYRVESKGVVGRRLAEGSPHSTIL
jgi:hypothetical protein